MKIAGVNFPRALISSLRDGNLVVFAGAGVSMGKPANLPNFSDLANLIASGTGDTKKEGERDDAFLGRLESKGVDVHVRAKQHLTYEGIQPTELHINLLKLFSDTQQIRVITTNFDLLFEQAAQNIYGETPEIFRAPALPSEWLNGWAYKVHHMRRVVREALLMKLPSVETIHEEPYGTFQGIRATRKAS